MLMKSISALITQVPAHLENHLNLKQQQRLPSLPWGLDFIKVEFWLLIVPCAHEKVELEEIGGADIAENTLDIHGSSSSRSAWGHKAIFLISMHPASPRFPPLNSQFPCDWLTGRSLQCFIAPDLGSPIGWPPSLLMPLHCSSCNTIACALLQIIIQYSHFWYIKFIFSHLEIMW